MEAEGTGEEEGVVVKRKACTIGRNSGKNERRRFFNHWKKILVDGIINMSYRYAIDGNYC